MRAIDQTDFESANVEYIQFWLQDPFLLNPASAGGQFYINLGNVSEDVLKDGRRQFENGLPGADGKALVDNTSVWGNVPANPIQVTTAFSNDPNDRPFQDVGFDGLGDAAEQAKFSGYLSQMATLFGVGSPVYQAALNDPSNDNFKNYRDASYDNQKANILARYKQINNPQGNSPIADPNATTTSAFTLYPDQEDLDHDNTLNELEEYFEYKINLVPGQLQVGQNFITDIRSFTPAIANGKPEKWYLFRVPVSDYIRNVGNLPDFKSIRFIRMFMTGFEDSVVCRFASLELVRNQWRKFSFVIDTSGNYFNLPNPDPTSMNVLAVNVEANSSRSPVPYVTPPGVERQQLLSNNNVNILQNEQAMSLQICNLAPQDSRGVFKNFNLDLRNYGTLSMFIHAEGAGTVDLLQPNSLQAVIRIGSDFVSNYYEIKIPLTKTNWMAPGSIADPNLVWPAQNNLNLSLQRLIALKVTRNSVGKASVYYKETDASGTSYAIIGNPNLGEVDGMFLGVENVSNASVCTEVWFNELRLSDLNEKGGGAALGRVDIKLADLGTLTFSGSYKGIGFGNLDQSVNQRSKEVLTQFDGAANLELGKFFPKKAGISIPTYASYSQTVSTPEYDPYDMDIKLKDKLKAPGANKDSIREQAVDETTIRSINFTNVRKINTTGKKQKLWSIENFDFSYSYTRSEHHSPLVLSDELIVYHGGLGYNFQHTPRYVEPFKRLIKSKSPWYKALKDFNFNPMPSTLSFRADAKRQFGAYQPREIGIAKGLTPETYNKYFTFDRYYVMRWDFTRSLNLDFTATNNARVDEAPGRLDSYERRQMWNHFLQGGRSTNYQHTATFSYVLPTSKIPALDWTIMRVGYEAKFNWTEASQDSLSRAMGNFLNNSQAKNASAELDFTRLYQKSRFLRAIDWDKPKAGARSHCRPATDRHNQRLYRQKRRKKKVMKDPNELPQYGTAIKVIGRLLTSVKKMGFTYTSTGTTSLAGYTDSTGVLGMDLRTLAPGWAFVLGAQPDTAMINKFAKKGYFTHNAVMNNLNRQDFNQHINVTAQLVPIRDFMIDVNLDKTFGKTYSELFKDTTQNGTGQLLHLSPYTAGSFSVSYISFKTLFEKINPNEVSNAFLRFENNRLILSQRLGKQNNYSVGSGPDGYANGYSRYSQDVLIPAFLAAYTGKDPNTISLIKQSNPNITSNPFSGIKPLPNWRFTYNGLSKLPVLSKIFSNITLMHGYTSNLSMNSFNSDLLYQDPRGLGFPGFKDSVSGDFIPYFLVPNVTISEAFAPLLSIDLQTVNQLGAKFEFAKSRQLSLSLVDYQLSETRSTKFTVDARWRKKNFPLPFRVPFSKQDTRKLQNDLTFTLSTSAYRMILPPIAPSTRTLPRCRPTGRRSLPFRRASTTC